MNRSEVARVAKAAQADEAAREGGAATDRRAWFKNTAGTTLLAATAAASAGLAGCASPAASGTSGTARASIPLSVPAGGRTLQGRAYRATLARPRGLVFAIHGGGYTSKYFDSDGQSALAFVAELGFNVVAIDRPGYGTNASWIMGYDQQVTVLLEALAWAQERYGIDNTPAFLYGHSIGGMLALLMANKAPERALGVSMTGSGARYHDRMLAGLKTRMASMGEHDFNPEAARIAVFLAPAGSFDPAVARLDTERDVPTLVADLKEAVSWPERLPAEAANARVPVHFVVGQYDGLWRSDAVGLAGVRELFGKAPFVDVYMQRFAGHSIELQFIWRDHVMKVIGFAEECLRQRLQPPSRPS